MINTFILSSKHFCGLVLLIFNQIGSNNYNYLVFVCMARLPINQKLFPTLTYLTTHRLSKQLEYIAIFSDLPRQILKVLKNNAIFILSKLFDYFILCYAYLKLYL